MKTLIDLPPAGPLHRPQLIELMKPVASILEIGPFDRPMITGDHVYYFDVLDQKALEQRAIDVERPAGKVPPINFVSPNGDLRVVDRTFAGVCSAHAIEHQTDLIRHLEDVANILEPGGLYFLAIPDKRYCFDHFNPVSTVADVIEAHREQRSVHSLSDVISTLGLFTHNDSIRHWAGDHANPGFRKNQAARIEEALKVFEDSNGDYVDVHSWRFTPRTFSELIAMLHKLGLTQLSVARVYQTPKPRSEFMAILHKV